MLDYVSNMLIEQQDDKLRRKIKFYYYYFQKRRNRKRNGNHSMNLASIVMHKKHDCNCSGYDSNDKQKIEQRCYHCQ